MADEQPSFLSEIPEPVLERGGLALSLGLLTSGAVVLALVLSGVLHGTRPARLATPPPLAAPTPTPVAGLVSAPARRSRAIVARPPGRQQRADRRRFADTGMTHVPLGWEAGFYQVYEAAQRTFGVNWLLLASIHKQESAFSTNPTTYHGLNFAGCCGGPMQFNVTNGPIPTWRRVSSAYRYAVRPRAYNHPTATHPSIYDDFDSITAAAWLLASDGASARLDGAAWQAAYDYYGHDATGVIYADEVLARAISWSQHGFCINCGLDPAMVSAVHAAYAPQPVVTRPALAGIATVRGRRAASARRRRAPRR